MSAEKRLDWKRLRAVFGKKASLVNDAGELFRVTGCITGAVPPFGSLFERTRTVLDPSLVEQGPSINFNAVSGTGFPAPHPAFR